MWNVIQTYFGLATASPKGITFPEVPWLPLKRIIQVKCVGPKQGPNNVRSICFV